MKTYRLYGAFLTRTVAEAIGAPAHVNQGDVIIVADTKHSALEMALGRKIMATMRDPNFRVAHGNDVDALRAAQMLERPTVLAHGSPAYGYVVDIAADGTARRIGRLAGGVFVRVDENPS
ncbi:hypothetical protein [Micromonospora sp. NPDC047730]|uniref:hypothetical protein n=1 Tax=Micromonospora sp. NPDC047730 TaxID=3364253 RepID=UPI003710B025